ncbi:MAG: hypothetical protein J6X66_02020 [Lachnospiraceae bacterium]|nr:hypothetical protein [Lachnospiraceae bacterium]
MPMVKAQCTNCGGALEVDDSKEAAVCPFCNTPYIIEKAVNLYNISNTYHIENAVFESNDSEDKLLKRGAAQLEMKEYSDASKTFRKMTKMYPENYRGWLGLSLADSVRNTKAEESDDIQKYRRNALQQCPGQEKDRLKNMYVRFSERIDILTAEIQKLETQMNKDKERLAEVRRRLDHLDKCYARSRTLKPVSVLMMLVSVVLFVVSIVMGKLSMIPAVKFGVVFLAGILLLKYAADLGGVEDTSVNFSNNEQDLNRAVEMTQSCADELKKQLDAVNSGETMEYYLAVLKGELPA